MKPNSADETYTYRVRATQEGASVTVSPEFWSDTGDPRHLERRIRQVCLEIEAAFHAYAAIDSIRH